MSGATRSGAGVLRTGALSMVALVALGLTRMIHGSLISHATDRATYGLVGTLAGSTVIASFVFPGGLSSAASKFIAMQRGAGRPAAAVAVHRFLSRLSLAAAAVLGAGSGLVTMALFHLDRGDAVAVALLTAAYSLYSVDKAALYGFGRTGPYAVLEVLTSGLAIATTVAVVVAAWPQYLLPLTAGYGTFVLGARRILRTAVHTELSTAAAAGDGTAAAGVPRAGDVPRAEVVGYAVVASVGTLSGAGFLQGTQLLAYGFGTAADAAYFAAAVALVAPLYFLPRALGLALFPAMAGAHGAGDLAAVREHADLFTRTLILLLAPVLVAAELLAPTMLTAFGGPDLVGGAAVLRLMLVATYLGVVQVPAVNALASAAGRRSWLPATSAVTGCLVGLVAVVVAGRPLGSLGVAVGYLVGVAIIAAGPIVAVWREGAMPWAGPLGRALALVAVSALAAPACTRALGDGTVATVAAAAAGLAVSVALLHRDLLRIPALARYLAPGRLAATSR